MIFVRYRLALLAVMIPVSLLASSGAQEQDAAAGFRTLAVLDAGKAPHQIGFSPDGSTAYIAAAGSDRITVIDVSSLRISGEIPSKATPLGVVPTPSGNLMVSRFAADSIGLLSAAGAVLQELDVGGGPSLFAGPLPDDTYLISVEKRNAVWLVDSRDFSLRRSYPTGERPFPPASTSDGRLAFVPNYGDGTVTVVDLWNERIRDVVPVGARPSGGVVLPGDIEYAVAVRGDDRVAFINTASFHVTGFVEEGIGEGPFSVVAAPGGRLAFINNTASHDISVLDLETKRVVERISVGEIPIVVAVHPSGETLWVASEGSHTVTVIEVPEAWRSASDAPESTGAAVTEVAVLGMIHGGHRESETWGLSQVRETIRRFAPDVVCAEIPPNRWEAARESYAQNGGIEEARVVRFPEYTDVLLALSAEMDFPIVPCAAWTQEMSDLRRNRMAHFDSDERFATERAEYEKKTAEVRAKLPDAATRESPRYIHSEAYDSLTREELALYDEYLNDWIGPGGWTNINESHFELIENALDAHRGKRILITYGAGHKYWFLDRLSQRDDVRLLDVTGFLPEEAVMTSDAPSNDMDSRCREEVFELHQFFEDWFGGVLGNSDDSFARFLGVVAEDFEIISPEGKLSTREELQSGLRSAHGMRSEEGMRIWIENYRSRSLSDDVQLVTYEEWQRISGATRARLSTAIFRRAPSTPNGVEWASVHEVWLAEDSR